MASGSTAPAETAFGRAKPGVLAASFGRLFRSMRAAALFAPIYAIGVTLSVALHFIWREQAFNTRTTAVLILFAVGALVAGFLAWAVSAMVAGIRPPSARFAAMTLFLTVATAGITAFIFFLQFRVYYAQGHSVEFTKLWLVQLMFTGASAVYIFLSSGLRLLLPFGLPVLFGAAYLFARKPRR